MHSHPPDRTAPTLQQPAARATAVGPWQVRLLGALEAANGAQRLTRFPSRAVGALLARLALRSDHDHAREELVDLLWPGVALDVGRNRLRQALSTLKSLLEPAGAPPVLMADRRSIRVLPGTLTCDAVSFEDAVRRGEADTAVALYRGPLMPGHYEEWVLDERQRLAALRERLDNSTARRAPVAPPWPLHLSAPSTPSLPSGLPNYWTRSIGTELSASRLRGLVATQRLVTVLGPGGSGKTRLAVEVATALRDHPPPVLPDETAGRPFDRVAFVPLVDCRDAAQTLDAVSSALRAEGTGPARGRIEAALMGSRALLVLDNLEQLDVGAGQQIAELLSAVPGLHVLGTSRRLLDLDGEHAFELDGLALPPAGAALAEAATNPAVLLFADRSRAARADFHLGPSNVAAVTALVRLLGGMPLAIELAASRVRSLTPAELLQRLTQDAGSPMLDLLARHAQRTTAGSRHASMRHVVEWSWRQLDTAEVGVLQAMAVLHAPASADAVAAVAGYPPAKAQHLLDALCEACLVRTVPAEGTEPRYSVQQPVREFAAERGTADAARAARQRLRRWLIGFARQTLPRGLAAAVAEMPHVHAAIVSAPADSAAADAVELALALRDYWDADEPPLSSLQALEQSLRALTAAAAIDSARCADMHELLAYGFGSAGLMAAAQRHVEAAVAAAVAAGDESRHARALARGVWVRYYGGFLEPATMLRVAEEAVVLARSSGDLKTLAGVLRVQAVMVSNLMLDYAAAEVLGEQAQRLWEQGGHHAMARTALLGRATMWAWQGRNEEALPVMRHCEEAAQADGDWAVVLTAARQQGRVNIRLRRWPQAVQAFSRALHVGWQRRHARGLANTLLNLPEALLMAGQDEAAAVLHGFALTHWARLYGAINRIEAAEQRRTRRLLRLRLGAARAETLRVQGVCLELPAAVELAQRASAGVAG